jgi:hypothetical protein
MTPRSLIAAACLTGLCLAAAPAADADWERVTAPRGGTADDQVAALRTSDGVLHVAWVTRTDRNTETLRHTAVAPDGTIGGPSATGTWLAGKVSLDRLDLSLTLPDGSSVPLKDVHGGPPAPGVWRVIVAPVDATKADKLTVVGAKQAQTGTPNDGFTIVWRIT